LFGISFDHNITQDAPPDVDPFGLVKEELTPLSADERCARSSKRSTRR
jgi:hypothetical protein